MFYRYALLLGLVGLVLPGGLGPNPASAATRRYNNTQLIDMQIRQAKQKAADFAKKLSAQKTKTQETKTKRDTTYKAYQKILDDQRRVNQQSRSIGTKLQSTLQARRAAFEKSQAMQKRLLRQKAWQDKMQEAEKRILAPLYQDPAFQQLRRQLDAAKKHAAQLESQPITAKKDLLAVHNQIIKLDQQINQRRTAALNKDPEYLLAKENVRVIAADIASARKKFDDMVRNSGEIMEMQAALDKANADLHEIVSEKMPPAHREYQQADLAYRQAASRYDYYNRMHTRYSEEVKRLEHSRRYMTNRRRRR